MALEKYDHEDLLIMEWIDIQIDDAIIEAIKKGLDWTPIRKFLHDHEKQDKKDCCHIDENDVECNSESMYVSYNARVGKCIVWCEKHAPNDASQIPNYPYGDDDEDEDDGDNKEIGE